ncbi:MAG: T9SS type A sorting domain-containing protein, partial [Bacteroidota bacterium]
LRITNGPFKLNVADGTYLSQSHRLIPGPDNSMYILYQSSRENVGTDSLSSPFVIRHINGSSRISQEYFIPAGGNLRGWHYHQNQIHLWKENSDDIYQMKIDPQTYIATESMVLPEVELRENLNFRYHQEGLSVLFREARNPGKGYDIFSYLFKDEDQDGFFTITDCNDQEVSAFPGAVDIPDNGVDEDCNGRDSTSQITTSTFESLKANVQVYPNPVMEQINIRIDQNMDYQVQLFDAVGRPIRQGNNLPFVAVNDLSPGIYTLVIRSLDERKRGVWRIMKRR